MLPLTAAGWPLSNFFDSFLLHLMQLRAWGHELPDISGHPNTIVSGAYNVALSEANERCVCVFVLLFILDAIKLM